MTEPFGFIVTRNISNELHKNYWRECVKCIRKFYPAEKIIIIDDNSKIRDDITAEYTNVSLVQSDYPKAGEILGYYYGWKYRPFKTMVVMHDCMFLQSKLPELTQSVLFLWHFDTYLGQGIEGAANDTNVTFLNYCEPNTDLFKLYYAKADWLGCFGAASLITLDCVDRIFANYNFLKCVQEVKSRPEREAMERVFAILAYMVEPRLKEKPSLLGNILTDYPGAYQVNWQNYAEGYRNPNIMINRVWSGR